jgi:hypothetical protein
MLTEMTGVPLSVPGSASYSFLKPSKCPMSTSSWLWPSVEVAWAVKYGPEPDLLCLWTHLAVAKTATTLLPFPAPPSA